MASTLGFNDKYKFGVELEFANDDDSLLDIYNLSIGYDVPTRYSLYHKVEGDLKFDKWILDSDFTVSKKIDDEYYGGEYSSRILSDDTSSWGELQRVCKLLNDTKSYISNTCSEHINVDISKYKNNPKFFELLYKIISLYEVEISTFYMGEYNYVRDSRESYAKNMSLRLLCSLSYVDFNVENFLNNMLDNSGSFSMIDGINLYKVLHNGVMEVRYPNGSINYDTIRNNINFTLSLIDAIGTNKFSLDELDYELYHINDDPFFKLRVLDNISDDEKFYKLSNIISRNSESNNNFNRQYKRLMKQI